MKLKKDLQKTAADLLRYPVVLAAVAMTVAMGTALYFFVAGYLKIPRRYDYPWRPQW